MNRRQFTQRLAALAAAPLMPAGAIAKATAPAAAPMHAFTHPYSWAAFVSRIHNKASPDMFKRQLSLSDDMAKQVFDTLVKENVITAPNALGISEATQPFRRDLGALKNLQPEQAFETDKSEIKTKRAEATLDEVDDVDKDLVDEELQADSDDVNQDVAELEDEDTDIEDSEDRITENTERSG